MSDKKNRKLLFIGPSPLAVGGVAVHIRRLAFLLKDMFDIHYVDESRTKYDGIFNLRSFNLIKYISLVKSSQIIHIHSGSLLLRIFHVFMCKCIFRKKTIVTIHRDVTREKCLSLTKFFVKKCDSLIVVNEKCYNIFKDTVGCLQLIPAFIPPVIENEPELPQDILSWIDKCRCSKDAIIMISNAGNLVMHEGCDLYGLDLCLDAMKSLVESKKNYYLLFVVADSGYNRELLDGYKAFIKKHNLEDNVLIWESGLSFVRLINHSDIVLRTTNTDGDALTIREALYFGKTVIASDVIGRPSGTKLFKNRDVDSLIEAISTLSANNDPKMKEHVSSLDDYRNLYLNIYN